MFGSREANRTLSFAELAAALHAGGSASTTSAEVEFKPPAVNFPNGTHVCEVEIDPETGVVDLVGYAAVEDIGHVINPMLAEGQIHGGIVQGVGQALGEEVLFDKSGQLLTGSFMDYRMPRAGDLPMFKLEFREIPTSANPLGAKGVGEAGTVGGLSACMNAINDALAQVGIRHFDMPASPHRVWEAIQQARNKGNGEITRP
jgi:carbon-monoxide dehydrogenase large subunit